MSVTPKTRIAIVLDKSGSMESTKRQAVEGLNEQIQQAKERAGRQDLRCSLVTFNGDVFEHLWDVPAGHLVEAKPDDFVPHGSTAMRDAMGYTVQKLLDTERESDRDAAYLVYVISDGETNSDAHYSPAVLRRLVEACQATGRWTFTYMGCSGNLADVQAQTGVPLSNMAAWSNATAGTTRSAFEHQKRRMKKFLDEREQGFQASANFASDTSQAGDFTEEPPPEEEVAPVPPPPPPPAVPPGPEAEAGLRGLLPDLPASTSEPQGADAPAMFGSVPKKVNWKPPAQK